MRGLHPLVTPDGRLRLLIQALVLESRGRRIVMDTCVGDGRERTMPPLNYLSTSFLADLAPAGCPQDRSFAQDARVAPSGSADRLKAPKSLISPGSASAVSALREAQLVAEQSSASAQCPRYSPVPRLIANSSSGESTSWFRPRTAK